MSPDDMLLVIASMHASAEHFAAIRRRVHAAIVEIELRNMLRVRHPLCAKALDKPHFSAWSVMYREGRDEDFLEVTSLTRSSFAALLTRFKRFYIMRRVNPRRKSKGGRPPKLPFHHQVLGLLLHFYVGRMSQNTLCQVFGVPLSTLNRIINKAEDAMHSALSAFAPARISWPSPARQRELAGWVAAREPLLPHTWGFIDGKNYKVTQPSHPDIQNAYYNGWLHCVFVTGTLCFAADGCIVWAKHNCPGSWNDGDTSLGFREKLLDATLNPDPRLNVVADSAFPCSNELTGRILTPLKDGDIDRIYPSRRQAARTLQNAITSVRQAAEWGVGSVEKVYGRLLVPLPPDVVQRGKRLMTIFRLANYLVRTTGINQIRTTFEDGYLHSS